MNYRNPLLAAACAATMGLASLPLTASAATVYFDVAPPAPRVEVTPAPRAGFTWVPGYWDVRGHRHVWMNGHWERERAAQMWIAGRWELQGNYYVWIEGHWGPAAAPGPTVRDHRH